MTTLTLRVTIIDPDIDPRIEDELQAWVEERYPDGIVEVRRTVTSTPRRPQDG